MPIQVLLPGLVLVAATSALSGADGWETLFNGRDLTGWNGNSALWRVEEGAIVGETVKAQPIEANTFLVWQGGDISDFEFTAKVRFRGNNSGVQYRSAKIADNELALSGYQLDLHPRVDFFGMLYGEKYDGRGIIAQRGQQLEIDADGKVHNRGAVGRETPLTDWDWNTLRIVAVGPRLIHQINGVTTIDVTDHHPSARRFGLLGLQLHRGGPMRVEFQDLQLRPLDAEAGAAALQQLASPPPGANAPPAPFQPVALAEEVSLGDVVQELSVAEGFQVELVYTVPQETQGSWVSLAVDPQGRLLASDQGEKGFYRITPGTDALSTRVEKVPVQLSGAQGLVFHHGSLYCFQSGEGLFRVTDTNGDDQLDHADLLTPVTGRGEHGTHAVLSAEDGQHLFAVAGNHTPLPDASHLAGARLPSWAEDLLLPRQWDAKGHARGILAPGGWITLFDPETLKHEVFCTGFRNQYDAALNAHGDLFTYDADMEWDLGLPWYRPTRICHAVSGGEFGWRSGSGKWPVYYEDSLPPVAEIGPGSPTGVVSGQGAQFPARYQHAIFALDWTYGRILALHLTPEGAGYQGDWETFIAGVPLPVTDAVVAPDGCLYFTVGGRGTQSALFRVRYSGSDSTAPAQIAALPVAAQTRRDLEAYHGHEHPDAVNAVWPHLRSDDRFLRYAARIAVESQPVSAWADKVFTQSLPQGRITAAVALARAGQSEHRAPLVDCLLDLDFERLPVLQQLGVLRALSLTFTRLGPPDAAERAALIARFDPLLPSQDDRLNTELLRLLVYINAPTAVPKGMALLADKTPDPVPDWADLQRFNANKGNTLVRLIENFPPTRRIGYAFLLRTATHGWTLDLRREFFAFLNEAGAASGGASYPGYLTNIREEALSYCTDDERRALADLIGRDFNPVPDFPIHPPQGPGREWSLDAAVAVAGDRQLKNSDFENGRSLFHAIKCGACHRFNGLGGGVGPDLTSVPLKFDTTYLLEATINPSKHISDQYSSSTVVLSDGRVLTGLVVPEDADHLRIFPADPQSLGIVVSKADVETVAASPVSQMPTGLINSLNEKELRDLIAYIMSGGNERGAKAKRGAD